MSSTIGDALRLTLFGRSHGPVIGMTLAGIPAGKALSPAVLQAFLDRRAPGRSPLSTPRREADIPRFLSGLSGGVTTGEDITAVIENTDVRSADYESLSTVPRPGHADYTAYVKYGRIEPGGGAPLQLARHVRSPVDLRGGEQSPRARERRGVAPAVLRPEAGQQDEQHAARQVFGRIGGSGRIEAHGGLLIGG